MSASGWLMRVMAFERDRRRTDGWSVLRRPEKTIPRLVQSIRFGSSSNASVTDIGVPPEAATTAMRPLA